MAFLTFVRAQLALPQRSANGPNLPSEASRSKPEAWAEQYIRKVSSFGHSLFELLGLHV